VNRFLLKLNRVFAWAVLTLMVGVLMTGYRMTGAFSFIPRGLADSLHRVYLSVPLIVLFIAHSLISIRVSYTRKHPRSALLDAAFLVAGAAFAVFFSYFALNLIVSLGR
jgi:hypothetical protein